MAVSFPSIANEGYRPSLPPKSALWRDSGFRPGLRNDLFIRPMTFFIASHEIEFYNLSRGVREFTGGGDTGNREGGTGYACSPVI
jgi:hypothetical protein